MDAPVLPPPLLDLLSNSIILNRLVNYLPFSSLFSLVRTSKSLRHFLLTAPDVWRYADLSKCRGAYTRLMNPIDSGGHSWRAERMDENLTEDEFYAGPLRGVLSNLRRMKVLPWVTTLILDGLASVTNDVLFELVTDTQYNIRILSVRACPNVNVVKLQMLLTYICRPDRPEGTPRLQGLYYLTTPHTSSLVSQTSGATNREGAMLGAMSIAKSRERSASDTWFSDAGTMVRVSEKLTLPEICKGVVWTDGVFCESMHHYIDAYDAVASNVRDSRPTSPPPATIALGPRGCASCGQAPADAPVWGESDTSNFPLLWPPPHSGSLSDAIRPPKPRPDATGRVPPQRLIASCSWCMTNRYCESCHRWWCAGCYNPKHNKNAQLLEHLRDAGMDEYLAGNMPELIPRNQGQHIKVFNGLCVEHCLVGEWMAGAGGGGMWG